MRETTNEPTEKAQDHITKKGYTSPRMVEYGAITNLTKGSSGSKADGAGSQGAGNQGAGS